MVVPRMTGKRIAIYYRMSNLAQEKSIDRQQAEVNPYVAAKRYLVVEECRDEGISGSEVLKRPGFQRILSLARAGQIDGIVIDDMDRFFRLDAIEGCAIVQHLREAGVWLESVSGGRQDYSTMAGRLMLAITSEAKHGQLVDTARRALTGLLRLARDQGQPPLPLPSYGYRREDDPEAPPRSNGAPQGKLVIVEEQALVITSIFEWYASGHPIGWIIRELHKRSVLSPKGNANWRRGTLLKMLANPVYVGDIAWGKESHGKFFRHKQGRIEEGNGVRTVTKNPRDEWLIATNTHPAIITSRPLWEKVQKRLAKGSPRTVRSETGEVLRVEGEPSTPTTTPGAFLLTKVLVCGQCHGWMTGYTRPCGTKEPAYVCTNYTSHSVNSCVRCEVREAQVVDSLVAELRRILAPEKQQFLRDRLRKRLAERRSDRNLSALRKAIADEEANLMRYRKRMLEVPSDMVEEVAIVIRECQAQMESAVKALEEAERSDPVKDLERMVDLAAAAIWSLEEALKDGDRLKLREALRACVHKVVVFAGEYQTSTGKTRRRPTRFEVTILPGSGLDTLADLDAGRKGSEQVIQIFLPACG